MLNDQLVEHVSACLAWYAHDLAAGPEESPGPVPSWPAGAPLPGLVREMVVAAEVLARVVDGADPGDRGWHPWGSPDPSGFAAIGSAELLIHTGDVADALALDWAPPAALAEALRARLFPEAPSDVEPWAAVCWAHTGVGAEARQSTPSSTLPPARRHPVVSKVIVMSGTTQTPARG